jgi:hypothetical protein
MINMSGETKMADIYPTDPALTTSTIERNKVFNYVKAMLGDGMVEVELDPKHYEIALDKAMSKFRQRSAGAVEESYLFLELFVDQNEYLLPNEVINVRSVFRRSVGSRTGQGAGGSLFEPFNLAYTNTYLMNSNQLGGIATYELYSGYQKLLGRIFGSYIEFAWNQTKHQLTLLQRPFAQGEQILIRTDNFRPDFVLLQDMYAKQWLYDYTLATCKAMLGEARSKFGTIVGPQSGTQLNGTALKSEADKEMEKLEKELGEHVAGGQPMTFILG